MKRLIYGSLGYSFRGQPGSFRGQLGSFRGQTPPLLRLVAALCAGRNRVKLHKKVDLGVLRVVLGGNGVVLGGKLTPY